MRTYKRKPTTPGEILKEEFLVPLKMTQKQLADHISCDVKVINRLINERCALTAAMALKLAATFRTSAEFWINAQDSLDIYKASRKIKRLPKPLKIGVANATV